MMKSFACSLIVFPLVIILSGGGISGVSAVHGQTGAMNMDVLQKALTTSQGTIRCILPGTLVRGETVTASFVAEADGKTAKKIRQNSEFLSQCRVRVVDQEFNLDVGKGSFMNPPGDGISPLEVQILDPGGGILTKTEFPLTETAPFIFPDKVRNQVMPVFPEVAEKGIPARIVAPFDGHSGTTQLRIGGQEAELLAESPRELWFLPPEDLTGLQQVELTEQGAHFEGAFWLVATELTASRINLRRGDKTEIMVALHHLRGLDRPIGMKLDNTTPGILVLEGGNQQDLVVKPEDVSPAGSWEKRITGTALAGGTFTVSLQVVPPPLPFLVQPLSKGETASGQGVNTVNPPLQVAIPVDGISEEDSLIKDPCKDPKFVEKENEDCAALVQELVNAPFHYGPELDFENFGRDWKDHFRNLSLTMMSFNMHLSMLKYWMGEGKDIEAQAEKVQALANIVAGGVDKGITAFKEGGEEAMKEVVKGVVEDQVMDLEKSAASGLSENLGTLYDLKDIAIRNIGLGIAKGVTGVYPDRQASWYREALEIDCQELSAWVANRYSHGSLHPDLQEGIADLADMLNRIDLIEQNFQDAVRRRGFICIKCTIPKSLQEEMDNLRMQIETEMRKFGDSIDRITQLLTEARAAINNKRAYSVHQLSGYYQGHSKTETENINRTLSESKQETREALARRKQGK